MLVDGHLELWSTRPVSLVGLRTETPKYQSHNTCKVTAQIRSTDRPKRSHVETIL